LYILEFRSENVMSAFEKADKKNRRNDYFSCWASILNMLIHGALHEDAQDKLLNILMFFIKRHISCSLSRVLNFY